MRIAGTFLEEIRGSSVSSILGFNGNRIESKDGNRAITREDRVY